MEFELLSVIFCLQINSDEMRHLHVNSQHLIELCKVWAETEVKWPCTSTPSKSGDYLVSKSCDGCVHPRRPLTEVARRPLAAEFIARFLCFRFFLLRVQIYYQNRMASAFSCPQITPFAAGGRDGGPAIPLFQGAPGDAEFADPGAGCRLASKFNQASAKHVTRFDKARRFSALRWSGRSGLPPARRWGRSGEEGTTR